MSILSPFQRRAVPFSGVFQEPVKPLAYKKTTRRVVFLWLQIGAGRQAPVYLGARFSMNA